MSKENNLEKRVLDFAKEGVITIFNFEGNLMTCPVDKFMEQPLEDILYDIDMLPEQIDIVNMRGVNKYACYMVIKTLYEKCEKLQAEINRINKPLE
jgi:hypothetical protein